MTSEKEKKLPETSHANPLPSIDTEALYERVEKLGDPALLEAVCELIHVYENLRRHKSEAPMITTERIMEIIVEKIARYDAGLAFIEDKGDVLKKGRQIKYSRDELLAIRYQILRESGELKGGQS